MNKILLAICAWAMVFGASAWAVETTVNPAPNRMGGLLFRLPKESGPNATPLAAATPRSTESPSRWSGRGAPMFPSETPEEGEAGAPGPSGQAPARDQPGGMINPAPGGRAPARPDTPQPSAPRPEQPGAPQQPGRIPGIPEAPAQPGRPEQPGRIPGQPQMPLTGSEKLISGKFCSFVETESDQLVPVWTSFDGKGKFKYGTTDPSNADLTEGEGDYRVQGDKIVLLFSDGASESIAIAARDKSGKIIEVAFQNQFFAPALCE